MELWSRGYSSRGMAIHFGCDERTIERRLGKYFAAGLEPGKFSDPVLYHLAMHSDNPRFLIAFLRRQHRRARRRTGMGLGGAY